MIYLFLQPLSAKKTKNRREATVNCDVVANTIIYQRAKSSKMKYDFCYQMYALYL